MATGGIENMSDEIINIKCCICVKKNIKTEAEKYCVVCQDYYCTSCADMHTLFLPSGVDHKLLDKSDFATTGQTTNLPSIPVERCDVHPTKLLDMYCKDHDKIICSSCVALKHRTCQDIHSVPDEINSLYQPAEYEEVKHKLQAVRKTMEDLKKAKENLLTKLDQSKKKAMDDIKAFRKEMEAFLDKLEAESMNDVEERYEKMKTNLDEDIDKIKDYSAKLEQSIIQLRESVGNKAQEFICLKLAEENIKHVKDMYGSKTEIDSAKIIFREDSKLRGLQNNVKKLGHIGLDKIYQQRVTAYQVKSEKEIYVNHLTDKQTARILGSCLLSRWLLFSDSNNDTLKRVDISTGLMKDVLKLDVTCRDVCVTNNEQAEVAVSTTKNFIQFVNIGKKMKATKQLKFNHECFGIACKNNQIFISDAEMTLYVYDTTCKKLLHSVEKDYLGKPIFDDNRHVTISGDIVYIADHKKGLIALDINGNYKFTLTDPALRRTQWVCPDRRGNLFVGGFDSTEIVLINEASHQVLGVFGKIIQTISACFDPELNKLVVTEDEDDKVKIYDLV